MSFWVTVALFILYFLSTTVVLGDGFASGLYVIIVELYLFFKKNNEHCGMYIQIIGSLGKYFKQYKPSSWPC